MKRKITKQNVDFFAPPPLDEMLATALIGYDKVGQSQHWADKRSCRTHETIIHCFQH